MADPIVLQWEERGLTELLRAITELNRTLGRYEKRVNDADKETQGFEKTTGTLNRQARGTARTMRAFGDAFSGVSSGAGRATRTAGRLLGVFANLGASGGGAGLAVAGAAAAMFGLAGASIQASRAVLDAARNGRELAETFAPYMQQGFVPPVSEQSLQSFDRINASFEALEIIGKAVALEIADELAPNIEGLATGAVALGLYIRDAADGLGEFLQSAYEVISGLDDLIESQGTFGRVLLGFATGGLSEAVVATGNFAEGIENAEGSTRDYLTEAGAFIGSVTEQIKLLGEGKNKARSYGRAIQEINPVLEAEAALIDLIASAREDELSDLDKAALAYSAVTDQIDKYAESAENAELVDSARAEAAARYAREQIAIQQEIAAAEDEATERRRQEAQEFVEEEEANHRRMVEGMAEAGAETMNAFSSIAGTISDVVARNGWEGAVAFFRAQQAAAAATAAVNTALAISAANASAPPPYNIPAIVAATAIGAAQIAAIVSQQPPQVQRHMGESMRGASDPLAPDEYRSGGRVLLRSEADTPGGVLSSQGVNALNAGRVSGGTQTVVVPWKHLDREIPRRIQNGDSRTSRSVRRAARREQAPAGRRDW